MTLRVEYDPETGQKNVFSDGHVVFTGPHIQGHVMVDGEKVNVTPEFIEADSQEHAIKIANAIGEHFALNGHPLHDDDNPFVHVPLELPAETVADPATPTEV